MPSSPRLAALALLLLGCPGAPGSASPSAAPPTPAGLPHPWPPAVGQPFPDLRLLDEAGRTVSLAGLRGRVLLVEPVGMSCAGCQALSGGAARGGFGGVTPQADLPSIAEQLRGAGIDPGHPELALVQVLFFDLELATPGVDDARAWASHFRLRPPGALVLLGDERYRAHPATHAMVPGFFLVDRDGALLVDASRGASSAELLPALARLLAPPEPLPDPAGLPEAPEQARVEEARAHLAAGRAAELDALLARERQAGRLEGRVRTRLAQVVAALATTKPEPEAKLAHLDAWVAAAPRSAWPLAVRAAFLKSWAWDARGSGYASTVTEEGWRLFAERLGRARVDVERALALDPACAPAHAVRLVLAYGMNVDPATAARWFEESCRVQPPLVALWATYLTYLMPKWHGDAEGKQMQALLQRALREHPDDPAWELLTLSVLDEAARGGASEAVSRERVRAGQAVVARYPREAEAWLDLARGHKALGDLDGWRAARLGAAEAGDPWCMTWVAERLGEGSEGFAPDRNRSRRLFWRAAHAGSAFGQAMVSSWYAEGDGVEADPAQAVVWLERAAAGGNHWAQETLAERCEAGDGVARDPARALALWRGLAAQKDDARRAAQAAARAARLEAAGNRRPRAHPDGFEDWYPDDVTPPAGTQYPCALTALPRALPGIPAGERRFVNHLASLLLQATHARLRLWRELQPAGLRRYEEVLLPVRAAVATEAAPDGLEPLRDDVVAALDLQLAFHREVVAGLEAGRAGRSALEAGEREGRFQAELERLVQSTAEGREASSKLHAAWGRLEARYGATWDPAVKDSLFHHLCALDLF